MATNMKPWILGIGIPVVLVSTYWSGGMPSKKERIRLKEELKASQQDIRTGQLAIQGREGTIHQLEARRQLDLAIQEIGGRNYGVARQHVSDALTRLQTAQKIGAATAADMTAPINTLTGLKDLTDTDAATLAQVAKQMDTALQSSVPAADAVSPVTVPPPTANDIPNLDITQK
ncbi:MAG: hypothetical protein QM758_04785 [Armatimonas sp.]